MRQGGGPEHLGRYVHIICCGIFSLIIYSGFLSLGIRPKKEKDLPAQNGNWVDVHSSKHLSLLLYLWLTHILQSLWLTSALSHYQKLLISDLSYLVDRTPDKTSVMYVMQYNRPKIS
jgi:hypothetical protein